MEYSGKLFGKVGNTYFPLEATTEDFEGLKTNLELTKQKLRLAEKALEEITQWDDDLEEEWGDPGNRANSALQKNMILDGF